MHADPGVNEIALEIGDCPKPSLVIGFPRRWQGASKAPSLIVCSGCGLCSMRASCAVQGHRLVHVVFHLWLLILFFLSLLLISGNINIILGESQTSFLLLT